MEQQRLVHGPSLRGMSANERAPTIGTFAVPTPVEIKLTGSNGALLAQKRYRLVWLDFERAR